MTTYKEAGVDIDEAEKLTKEIGIITKKYNRLVDVPLLNQIGGFSAAFEIPERYKHPVLVTSTDGVGTKLKLALQLGMYDSIGTDLVAMVVNDIITCGARPLVFLDYYGTAKLDTRVSQRIIENIAFACCNSKCSLIGGETAELPGVYAHSDAVELVGFGIGVVEKTEIIDGTRIEPGNALIGIPSNGFHSNGYSLINKVLSEKEIDLNQPIMCHHVGNEVSLGSILMRPTKIYTPLVLDLIRMFDIRGIAHITGGGIPGNVPRILPGGLKPMFNWSKMKLPPLFKWIQDEANLTKPELFKTFNCGFGLVLCTSGLQAMDIVTFLTEDLAINGVQIIGHVGASYE